MNAVATVGVGRELTVIERARVALSFDETKAVLAELAAQGKLTGITVVNVKDTN